MYITCYMYLKVIITLYNNIIIYKSMEKIQHTYYSKRLLNIIHSCTVM